LVTERYSKADQSNAMHFDEKKATNEKTKELYDKKHSLAQDKRDKTLELTGVNQVSNYVEFTKLERKLLTLGNQIEKVEEQIKQEELKMPRDEQQTFEAKQKIGAIHKAILKSPLFIAGVVSLFFRGVTMHLDVSKESLWPMEYLISEHGEMGGFEFSVGFLWVYICVRAANRVMNIFS
jgi:hypothetical protein